MKNFLKLREKNSKRLEAKVNTKRIQKALLSDLTQEIIIPLALFVILIFLANPIGFAVPPAFLGALVFALVVVFTLSAFFYWQQTKNKKGNGIEFSSFSERISFFATATVLVAGIVIQSLLNVLDIWLALALAVLVGGRVWGKIYTEIKKQED